jgi:hypothetical protein
LLVLGNKQPLTEITTQEMLQALPATAETMKELEALNRYRLAQKST